MPRTARSSSPKSAPPPRPRRRARPKKTEGARILTREELMARTVPPAPGMQNGHEWLRELFRPMRKYHQWLIKNGHPEGLGQLDSSLREEGHDPEERDS